MDEGLVFLNRDARENHDEIRYFDKPVNDVRSIDQALLYSRARGNLPIFSIDMNDTGGYKFFVVTGYRTFARRYVGLPRPDSCLRATPSAKPRIEPFAYEIVLENVPLDIYLDIEGSKETNPNVDFDRLYRMVMDEFQMFTLQMSIAAESEIKTARHVVLDSSTDKKFSKHVIVRFTNCVFANNYVCGALMRNFHLHLLHRWPGDNPFYIMPDANKKSQQKQCVVDLGVYTKNRNFRLMGSCKRKGCAQANPIRWMWLEDRPGAMDEQLFLASLIQRRDPVARYIVRVVDTINGGVPVSSSLTTAQPVVPARRGGGGGGGGGGNPRGNPRLTAIGEHCAQWIERTYRHYFHGIDGEIRHRVEVGEWNGDFMLKVNFPDVHHCRVRLQITGSAIHRSNSIYFIANLRTGQITQRCASSTCAPNGERQYAPCNPPCIPKHYLDQFQEIFGTNECLFPMEDADD